MLVPDQGDAQVGPLDLGLARAKSQNVAVTTIILFHCVYLPDCRSLTESAYRIGWFSNRYVCFGIAATVPLQLCFVYAPTLVALAGLPAVALENRFWRRHAKSGRDGTAAASRQEQARS